MEQKAHRAEIAARAFVKPQAIVILSADGHTRNPKNLVETVDPLTLTSLRFGVRLHREAKLPVLVTARAQLLEFLRRMS